MSMIGSQKIKHLLNSGVTNKLLGCQLSESIEQSAVLFSKQNGSGSGSGSGSGYGYGDGSGSGSGDGDGYGDGSGYGEGYGEGYDIC